MERITWDPEAVKALRGNPHGSMASRLVNALLAAKVKAPDADDQSAVDVLLSTARSISDRKSEEAIAELCASLGFRQSGKVDSGETDPQDIRSEKKAAPDATWLCRTVRDAWFYQIEQDRSNKAYALDGYCLAIKAEQLLRKLARDKGMMDPIYVPTKKTLERFLVAWLRDGLFGVPTSVVLGISESAGKKLGCLLREMASPEFKGASPEEAIEEIRHNLPDTPSYTFLKNLYDEYIKAQSEAAQSGRPPHFDGHDADDDAGATPWDEYDPKVYPGSFMGFEFDWADLSKTCLPRLKALVPQAFKDVLRVFSFDMSEFTMGSEVGSNAEPLKPNSGSQSAETRARNADIAIEHLAKCLKDLAAERIARFGRDGENK